MKKLLSILAISIMVCFTSCDKTELSKDKLSMVVQPSWGDAFHYANKSVPSQWPNNIIAIIVLIVWPVAVYVYIKKANGDPMWPSIIGSIAAVALIFLMIARVNKVRMDNVHTVPKEYYDRVGKAYILDSLFETNHMQSAPKIK